MTSIVLGLLRFVASVSVFLVSVSSTSSLVQKASSTRVCSCRGGVNTYTKMTTHMTMLVKYENKHSHISLFIREKLKYKSKVLPYLLPSVGPGADPGVQAVRPQATCHPSGGRLSLLSARPAVTFPAEERHRLSTSTKLYC